MMQPVLHFAKAHHKQAAIAEFASVRNSRRPAWLRAAGKFLAHHDKQIAAAYYYNEAPHNHANSDCVWRLSSAQDAAAFRAVASKAALKK
jgi:hypothetical protein